MLEGCLQACDTVGNLIQPRWHPILQLCAEPIDVTSEQGHGVLVVVALLLPGLQQREQAGHFALKMLLNLHELLHLRRQQFRCRMRLQFVVLAPDVKHTADCTASFCSGLCNGLRGDAPLKLLAKRAAQNLHPLRVLLDHGLPLRAHAIQPLSHVAPDLRENFRHHAAGILLMPGAGLLDHRTPLQAQAVKLLPDMGLHLREAARGTVACFLEEDCALGLEPLVHERKRPLQLSTACPLKALEPLLQAPQLLFQTCSLPLQSAHILLQGQVPNDRRLRRARGLARCITGTMPRHISRHLKSVQSRSQLCSDLLEAHAQLRVAVGHLAGLQAQLDVPASLADLRPDRLEVGADRRDVDLPLHALLDELLPERVELLRDADAHERVQVLGQAVLHLRPLLLLGGALLLDPGDPGLELGCCHGGGHRRRRWRPVACVRLWGAGVQVSQGHGSAVLGRGGPAQLTVGAVARDPGRPPGVRGRSPVGRSARDVADRVEGAAEEVAPHLLLLSGLASNVAQEVLQGDQPTRGAVYGMEDGRGVLRIPEALQALHKVVAGDLAHGVHVQCIERRFQVSATALQEGLQTGHFRLPRRWADRPFHHAAAQRLLV
mmetsp:Transcript_70624/g.206746  ORF Transcript_70624/g.206746 Transcript_70624/m.206746 type:complete len:605 (+) Transcript_70624:1301-3115(+)